MLLCPHALLFPQATTASAAKKPRLAHLRRRNSTGTIFLSHTMSNQDNAATIECVCVVIRAHMLGEFLSLRTRLLFSVPVL
jgi:hypothetical protein